MRKLLIVLLFTPAYADFNVTQTGGTGWVCNGPAVTEHTTVIEAIESCADQSLSANGAEYEVTFESAYRVSNTPPVAPEPEPDPTPDPTPDPVPDPDPPGDWPAEVPAPFSADLPACSAPDTSDDKWVVLSDSNCVSTGISVFERSLQITGSNVYVRDFEVNGNGATDKVGVRVSGSNVVLDNGNVHHLLGNDRHCYTVSGGSSDIWIINSDGWYCSGDGFQAGHQSASNPPSNIYLVRNRFWGNRENGIDLKYINNFIAAENEHFGHRRAPSDSSWCLPDMPDRCSMQNSGSDGTDIVVGSDGGPTGWAFYREVMHDSDGCIRIEEANSEGIIEGVSCTNTAGTALQLDKKSGRIRFADNVIDGADRGIFQNWRDGFSLDVDGNSFVSISGPVIEYEAGSVGSVSTLTDNDFLNTGPVIYNNQVASTEEEINALPGASGNTVN